MAPCKLWDRNRLRVPSPADQLRLGVTLVLAYLAWFYINLGSNGLFYIANTRDAAMRLPGSLVYYLGVCVVGVVAALHLIRRWRLPMRWWPRRVGVRLVLGGAALLAFAVLIGVAAMGDQGLTLVDLGGRSLVWLLAPIPIFIPTMLAYTLLWHVLFLQGFRRLFDAGSVGTVAAVLATAAIYAVYHLASIDEIHGLDAMLGEIGITFVIRVVLLASVVWTRSIGPAFVADLVMNYLVFLPMEHFHPPVWQWPIGLLILGGVWLLYRWGARRVRHSTTAFHATHPASPSVTAGQTTKNSSALASR